MCIAVFMWKAHPIYPFLLFLNRDEFFNRPTKALGRWDEDEVEIVGGRDEIAGGTWLASSLNGRISFVTNFRELNKLPQSNSRGHLPIRFLKSKKSPKEFAEQLVDEAEGYNGFNLIVADVSCMSMYYITNRHEHHGVSVTEVSPGIHVLSNANLDTPWPKAQRLQQSFIDVLDKYGNGDELPMKEIAENIMRDRTKDEDESKFTHIYPPEFEYQLSSVFVETETAMGHYGTRSTSALTVKTDGEVSFYEMCNENDLWKEHQINYRIHP